MLYVSDIIVDTKDYEIRLLLIAESVIQDILDKVIDTSQHIIPAVLDSCPEVTVII